jgi:hypothetical protein
MSRLMIIGALTASALPPADLAWLEGEWCTVPANGQQTCELWGPARGGTMLGTSQSVRDRKTRDFEFMRIELGETGAVFHGSPRAAPAVPFIESARDATSITFVNAGHDYPQRIRYRREGDTLTAEISLADGSRPMRWSYRRIP